MHSALFSTHDGVSVPAVTAAEMRELDRIAIEETGPSLLQMMEHAGRSLAEVVLRMLESKSSSASVLVLAGTGGNGGGGICAARHLSERVADVSVCLTDIPLKGPRLGASLRHSSTRAVECSRHATLSPLRRM
jgi:NAD(P)H-hydrate epimerase